MNHVIHAPVANLMWLTQKDARHVYAAELINLIVPTASREASKDRKHAPHSASAIVCHARTDSQNEWLCWKKDVHLAAHACVARTKSALHALRIRLSSHYRLWTQIDVRNVPCACHCTRDPPTSQFHCFSKRDIRNAAFHIEKKWFIYYIWC